MKAVIFARVSTKEQEEGYSIEAQRNRLLDYCSRKNLSVLKTYEIVESSTKGDRKKFKEMLAFVEKQKETIAIVVDKVDRAQRKLSEIPLLEEYIKSGKVELHFNTEGYTLHKDSQSQAKLMWGMNVLMAQSYTDSISDNVKRSNSQKVANGEWCGPAPLGYLNIDDPVTRKKDIILDSQRAFLVKRIFEEYGTGNYSMCEIARLSKEWGLRSRLKNLPIGTSTIETLLKNPFYHGYMIVKGEIHKHRYTPLIDYKLFQLCQDVIAGHNKKPFKYAGLPFIFRGLVRCAKCGTSYSSEIKKGKHVYLRPKSRNGCDCKPIKQEVVLEELSETMKGLRIPAHIVEEIHKYLKANFEAKKKHQNAYFDSLQNEYKQITSKLDSLLEVRLEGSITKVEYDKKASSFKQRQIEVSSELDGLTRADQMFSETLSSLLDITSRAYELFESSEIEEKRKLVNFVFPNLEIRDKKLEKSIRKPLGYVGKIGKNGKWLPRKDSNLRPID